MAIVAEYQYEHGVSSSINDDCFRDKTPEELEADREITRRIMRQIAWEAELKKFDGA